MRRVMDRDNIDCLELARDNRSAPARPSDGSSGLKRAVACAALGVAFGMVFSAPSSAQSDYQTQSPPPQAYPPPQGYQPPPQGYPPQGYQAPQGYPPPQGYQAQGYPPPPGYYPPAPAYEPPPPGAVWVGAPGQCLYGNGAVYWCAPGVVFDGFPPGWDYARFPVLSFGPGIIVDPIWFGGWRVGHPGFAFRGRLATEGERQAFAAHRGEIIRNAAAQAHDHPGPRPGRPGEER